MYKFPLRVAAFNRFKIFALTSALLMLTSFSYSQETPTFAYHRTLTQGVDYQISTSSIITGGSSSTLSSIFGDAQNSYLHAQLSQNQNVSYIQIDLSMFSNQEIMDNNIYILGSTASIATPLINSYPSNQAVLYQQVIKSKKVLIPLGYASYKQIGIFSNKENLLNVNNVKFVIGSNTGPGPGPIGSYELNCVNNEDDDKDGFVDCQDSDCLPTLDYFNIVHPTCPICNDGSIRLVTNLPSFRPGCYFSIDGGLTWTYSTFGAITFENLTPGNYSVMLSYFAGEQNACRTTPFAVTLNAPPRGKEENCENGGLEYGTFQNWTGGVGTYATNTISIPNNDIEANIRHTIIASDPNKFDPYVGNLFPLVTPDGGTYFTKLGNDIINANVGKATRLKYKFTVNETNKDFVFWWAAVSQAFHLEDGVFLNPKIYGTIRDISGTLPDRRVLNQIIMDPSNDRFFTILEDDIVFRGWTCQREDLTIFLNHEVEIEFIVTDCVPTGHWAYMYIDALCSQTKPIEINCKVNAQVMCKGQDPNVTVAGNGYNEYRWTISKLNSNGVAYDTRVLPWRVGYVAITDGIMDEYINSGVTYECVDYFFALEVKSSCDNTGNCSFKMLSSCSEYDIDYCDNLIVFNHQLNPIIPGTFNCVGCTYAWTPTKYLQETSDDKNPTIKQTTWTDALDRDYMVNVTTPEGCVFNDIVKVKSQDINVESVTTYGYCDVSFDFTVDFGFPVPTNGIVIKLKNETNNESFTDFNLVSESSDGHKKTYTITGIDRNLIDPNNLVIEIEFEIVENNDVCFDISKVKLTRRFEVLTAPSNFNWSTPWFMVKPYWFIPNGTNEDNKTFFIRFNTWDDQSTCLSYSRGSSIYWAKLTMFDEWGGVMIENEASVDPTSNSGLTGKEVEWDGRFEGQMMNPSPYTFMLEIRSCSKISHCDREHTCDEDNGYFCSDGEEYRLIRGTIQLIN